MIVYHLTTGNYLHRCKKIFPCKKKLVEFLAYILKMSSTKLCLEFIESSYRVVYINTELLPEYELLYSQSEIKEPYHFSVTQQSNSKKIINQLDDDEKKA